MQTMLVASGCKTLIDQEKTTSIRGLFYLLKHTIEGTKEETFADQNECDHAALEKAVRSGKVKAVFEESK